MGLPIREPRRAVDRPPGDLHEDVSKVHAQRLSRTPGHEHLDGRSPANGRAQRHAKRKGCHLATEVLIRLVRPPRVCTTRGRAIAAGVQKWIPVVKRQIRVEGQREWRRSALEKLKPLIPADCMFVDVRERETGANTHLLCGVTWQDLHDAWNHVDLNVHAEGLLDDHHSVCMRVPTEVGLPDCRPTHSGARQPQLKRQFCVLEGLDPSPRRNLYTSDLQHETTSPHTQPVRRKAREDLIHSQRASAHMHAEGPLRNLQVVLLPKQVAAHIRELAQGRVCTRLKAFPGSIRQHCFQVALLQHRRLPEEQCGFPGSVILRACEAQRDLVQDVCAGAAQRLHGLSPAGHEVECQGPRGCPARGSRSLSLKPGNIWKPDEVVGHLDIAGRCMSQVLALMSRTVKVAQQGEGNARNCKQPELDIDARSRRRSGTAHREKSYRRQGSAWLDL
mmetsp:Transcript_56650/g.184317  ORF Transcript_56650/g.184317 Transcript_56650/m.184317 type:complete len:447 (+) Transcript_56650:28-1368(+)